MEAEKTTPLRVAPGRQGPWSDEWGSGSPEEGGVFKQTELLGLGRQGLSWGLQRMGSASRQEGRRASSEAGSGASMCWGRLQARGGEGGREPTLQLIGTIRAESVFSPSECVCE